MGVLPNKPKTKCNNFYRNQESPCSNRINLLCSCAIQYQAVFVKMTHFPSVNCGSLEQIFRHSPVNNQLNNLYFCEN